MVRARETQTVDALYRPPDAQVRRDRNRAKRLRRALRANPPKGPRQTPSARKLSCSDAQERDAKLALRRRRNATEWQPYEAPNRKVRRQMARLGFTDTRQKPEVVWRSTRTERSDGRCVTRKVVRT